MNDLQIFENAEFGKIRTVLIDDEPWFVGKDVAEALGYAKTRNAILQHVDEEDKKGALIQGGTSGNPNMIIINESGLYSLIFASKLPNAKKFKRWVTSEVLPSIRKTGQYGVQRPKADSVGEIVDLIRITRETMVEKGSDPKDIAETVDSICNQFGVELPRCFARPEETTMRDIDDMIDFIFAEKEQGRTPTYRDFIICRSTVKRIEG